MIFFFFYITVTEVLNETAEETVLQKHGVNKNTAAGRNADRNIDIMTSNSSCEACRDFFFSLFHSILLVEYIMKTLIEFLICQYRTAPPYYFLCISETAVTKSPGPPGWSCSDTGGAEQNQSNDE